MAYSPGDPKRKQLGGNRLSGDQDRDRVTLLREIQASGLEPTSLIIDVGGAALQPCLAALKGCATGECFSEAQSLEPEGSRTARHGRTTARGSGPSSLCC